MGKTPDPLIAALDAAAAPKPSIAQWMQQHPDWAAAVLRAHAKGVSYQTIAEHLTSAGYEVTNDTVRKWCKSQAQR